MEEKKGTPRFGGSKVSEIANIFQNRAPHPKEEIFAPLRKPQKLHENSAEKLIDAESPTVTVMRTESHAARFNNARAMFEKLGSEDAPKAARVVPLQGTKSASNVLDRSRSSSANSDVRETKSQSSRSPSPPKPRKNGVNGEAKANGNEPKVQPSKPQLMKKPEKPERKFNSKELIERQKNWTSHFSKTRNSRYHSDPNKAEVKLAVNNHEQEPAHTKLATRSSSFANSR